MRRLGGGCKSTEFTVIRLLQDAEGLKGVLKGRDGCLAGMLAYYEANHGKTPRRS